MCTVFNCLAYNDVAATIRLDGQVVFIALDDANTSVHVTLNPLQVRTLAKYLEIALSQIDFANLLDEQHFGNLTVKIEQNESEELAAAS